MIYSTDGIVWKTSLESPSTTLNDLCYDGTRFHVVTSFGTAISCSVLEAPAIFSLNNIQVFVGQPFSHWGKATNQPVTYSATDLPPGAYLDQATGLISGAPSIAGTYFFALHATNPFGSDTQVVTMIVLSAPLDLPLPANRSSTVGVWFEWLPGVTPNGATYSASGIPSGLQIDPVSGRLFGIPTTAGFYNITITASHPSGNRTGVLSLSVYHPAPLILLQPEDQAVEEGGSIILCGSAVGGGNIHYQWLKSGQPLSDSSGSTQAFLKTFTSYQQSAPSRFFGSQEPTLTIGNAQKSDAGDYQLIVSNESGSSFTRTATIRTFVSFLRWGIQRGLPISLSRPQDNPEYPGITNLMAYALGIPSGANASHYVPALGNR